jgi:hypothetical protein
MDQTLLDLFTVWWASGNREAALVLADRLKELSSEQVAETLPAVRAAARLADAHRRAYERLLAWAYRDAQYRSWGCGLTCAQELDAASEKLGYEMELRPLMETEGCPDGGLCQRAVQALLDYRSGNITRDELEEIARDVFAAMTSPQSQTGRPEGD